MVALEKPPVAMRSWPLRWNVTLLLVANAYAGWIPLPRRTFVWVMYAGTAAFFLGPRYPPRAWGMAWPTRRG